MEFFMIEKMIMILSGALCFTSAQAFQCYLTFVKDSCWIDYEVTVTVQDPSTHTQLMALTVPKGKSWLRQSFTCQPGQKILYQAQFSPVFWQSDIGKIYNARSYWALPSTIKNKVTAWDIPVCFAEAFSEVPLPPRASGHCQCDFKSIPAIPLPVVPAVK